MRGRISFFNRRFIPFGLAVCASLLGFAGERASGSDASAHGSFSQSAPSQLEAGDLSQAVAQNLLRVEEFGFIREQARKMGVRVWLFGGTAAGFAHYVKMDLLRQRGDSRYRPDRFDYHYTNIYRSTQDLDIVIDGNIEQVEALQEILQSRYQHFQGSKTAWEVRSLTHPKGAPDTPGYKEALLNDQDFLNQHTDSHSTGMIEISDPPAGEALIRDLRDWASVRPKFLSDVANGELHFYFSDKHQSTIRFQSGTNPPIFSVIRALTKAFQYELRIHDWELFKQMIAEFNPAQDLKHPDAERSIQKLGKKLFMHAVSIEYAWEITERLGLRKRLVGLGDASAIGSLSWWMGKEPLRGKPLGEAHAEGAGKSAAELGIDVVAHETSDYLAYESITRAHTGEPNVTISRQDHQGERAAYGDGFYTRLGRSGAAGTGLTIRFKVDLRAREGVDFKIETLQGGDTYVIFSNKNALRVIPESLHISVVQFFELLAGKDFSSADFGIYERLKRRFKSTGWAVSAREKEMVYKIVRKARSSSSLNVFLLKEWLASPFKAEFPDLLPELWRHADANVLQRIWQARVEPTEHYRRDTQILHDRMAWLVKRIQADLKSHFLTARLDSYYLTSPNRDLERFAEEIAKFDPRIATYQFDDGYLIALVNILKHMEEFEEARKLARYLRSKEAKKEFTEADSVRTAVDRLQDHTEASFLNEVGIAMAEKDNLFSDEKLVESYLSKTAARHPSLLFGFIERAFIVPADSKRFGI